MTRLTLQGRLKPQLAVGGGDGNKYSTTMMIEFEHKLVVGGGGGAPSLPLGLLLHKSRFSIRGGDSTAGSCTGSFKVFASSTKSSPPSSSSPSAKKKSIQSKYFSSPSPSRGKEAATRDYDDNDDGNGAIVYDDCEDDFIEREDELSCFRGLVLDISYRPVNVVCWKRAICLEFMEKADVLEYYDQTVDSPSGSFYIPAVLRVPHLLQVVKRRRIRNTLSRKNIYFRDSFTCQYCSSRESLTVDHVLPVSRGGEWKWENLVTACYKCNSKKGHKTAEEAKMQLLKVPKAPKEYEILAIPLTNAAIKMLKMRKGTPEEWHQYLSKPSSSGP